MVVEVLFSMRVKYMFLRIDQWGEKIERMFSDENVFRLTCGSVRLAATEGTCSGV